MFGNKIRKKKPNFSLLLNIKFFIVNAIEKHYYDNCWKKRGGNGKQLQNKKTIIENIKRIYWKIKKKEFKICLFIINNLFLICKEILWRKNENSF